jgi:CelD/BcsL family acetyltransferase involved in cellulose biosynthesis
MANAKKWMQIDFLTLDGKNIAAFLHFRYGGRLYLYLIVVDKTINPKISIGNIMIGLCTENAYKNQIFFYDFLKGAENYKFFWANSGQRSLNIFFCKRELIPILISWGKLIKYGLKLFLR